MAVSGGAQDKRSWWDPKLIIGNSNKRNDESDKTEGWLDRDSNSKRYSQHKRRSSGHHGKVLESLDHDDARYWPHQTDFNDDDMLDSDNKQED